MAKYKKPKVKEITDKIIPTESLEEYMERNNITVDEMFGEKGVDYAQGGIVKVKKKKKKMKKPRGVGAALRGYGKACS
tara:strand:- start:1961 stop:2194 length:234 start_codon:yes stop_codon:yes gene_type:complete